MLEQADKSGKGAQKVSCFIARIHNCDAKGCGIESLVIVSLTFYLEGHVVQVA